MNRKIRLCLAMLPSLLAGCAGYAPPVTVPVKVPVYISCHVAPLPEPDWYIRRLPPGADVVAKLKAAFADLELSKGYIKELQAELSACG